LNERLICVSFAQIRNATELDFLKGLDLLELSLDGNPICESFEDQAAYIRLGHFGLYLSIFKSSIIPLFILLNIDLRSKLDSQLYIVIENTINR